jgi:hypothetical protein
VDGGKPEKLLGYSSRHLARSGFDDMVDAEMLMMDHGVTRWMLIDVDIYIVDVDSVDRVWCLPKVGKCEARFDVM